jgi:predicted metal-dependent peptidase
MPKRLVVETDGKKITNVSVEEIKVDPRVVDQAKKRMEWIVSFMIVRYHFVYQILAMMTKRVNPGMGTMGVRVISGGNFELSYDPEFILKLSDESLTYILYHEILHLALHHCTHRRFDDHALGNTATDLAVNELIPEVKGSCEPPSGELRGCHVDDLKKMPAFSDIQNKQTSEWYYDYLRKKQKEQSGGKGKGKGKGDGKGDKQSGKGFDDHGGWKECEVADEKIRAKIDEIAKNELWGDVGGAERELILAAQTRRVNWRNVLRQFYGNQVWHEREATRKRPNRRTGYIHPGARKIQLDRHLVAVDTSGSIDSDLLAQFLATVNQMTDYVPIDIMQCDCGVTETPRPFDRRKKEFEFKGRGGTSFQPIMDVVNERHYKSVVVLTDGQASECTQPKARVVWVLPVGNTVPVDWGMKIYMSRHV